MEEVQNTANMSKKEILKSLIEDYGENIKKLAFLYVKDWSAAEDITQEVYIKCYQKLDSFRGDSSYKTWLYKIAINTSKDYLKSKWYRNFLPTDFLIGIWESGSSTPEEAVVAKLEDQELSRMMLSLPAKYREVIILFYYENLKMKEIEELTGLNLDTIKTRLRRGKLLLQKKLEGSVTHGTAVK